MAHLTDFAFEQVSDSRPVIDTHGEQQQVFGPVFSMRLMISIPVGSRIGSTVIRVGLGANRTLSNLEQNPLAVLFCITESPVSFGTPGYRLYLKAKEIQKQGSLLDGVKQAIAEHAGQDAAKMIVAGVAFEVTEVRPLVAMG